MNTRERLGYSLTSALAADVLVSAVCEWISPPNGPHHWWAFLGFAALMLIGVIPAWLVFAVLVVLIDEPKAWKGVLFFFLGCYVGPFVLSVRHPLDLPLNPWRIIRSPDPLMRIATAISVLTTLLYLGTLELTARRRIQSTRHDR